MKVIILKDDEEKILISDEKTGELWKIERTDENGILGLYLSEINEDAI